MPKLGERMSEAQKRKIAKAHIGVQTFLGRKHSNHEGRDPVVESGGRRNGHWHTLPRQHDDGLRKVLRVVGD